MSKGWDIMNRKSFLIALFGFLLGLNKKISSMFKKDNKTIEDSLKPDNKLLG